HAGDDRGWVDQALAERGLRRRVAVTVPHFGAAPLIVADSDMIATVPSRIAAWAAARMRLRVLPPPIPSLAHQFVQVWHCRQSRNASHQWLRQVIRDCCAAS
ncbi:MAG TPA: LysR substrate-binding domain-containing protein, partial [Arenibaculum sp.]|nr:LysR substrate-binding domain-containing protein [Arenibaculum sp.]